MAHVVDVELPLQIEIKGREGHHVLDLGDTALESGAVGGQEAVALHADPHGLAVLHLLGLHRHHTADGGLHQTHGFVKFCFFFIRELFLNHSLDHQVGIHQVLTDDDIQGFAACGPALTQAGYDIGDDELQNSGTHGGGHDVAAGDSIGGGLSVVAVHGGDILHQHILVTAAEYIADGITFVLLQMLHNGRCHIDKGDTVAGLAQQRTDKTAADITAAIHNSIHGNNLLS